MSELMGNIVGKYDAKPTGLYLGISLHNMMLPHGPDKDAFEGASNADLKPRTRKHYDSHVRVTVSSTSTEFAAKEAPSRRLCRMLDWT